MPYIIKQNIASKIRILVPYIIKQNIASKIRILVPMQLKNLEALMINNHIIIVMCRHSRLS